MLRDLVITRKCFFYCISITAIWMRPIDVVSAAFITCMWYSAAHISVMVLFLLEKFHLNTFVPNLP